MVNSLLTLNGQQPRYPDLTPKESASQGAIRRDQFFGQPLSTVVKEILSRRRAANQGPASVNDIHKAMLDGGYQFDAKDDENAKRGLRISLTKNSALFIKLPHGDYGLRAWYPAAKEPRQLTPPVVKPSRFRRDIALLDDNELVTAKPTNGYVPGCELDENTNGDSSERPEERDPEIKNGETDEFDFATKLLEEPQEEPQQEPDFGFPNGGQEDDIPF